MMSHVSTPTLTSVAAQASPEAARASRPSWRDPRLALGVLLVCASAVLGARLLASADDTVPVVVAAAPLPAGERLTPDDLTTTRVRFGDDEDADQYLPAGTDVTGSVLLRPVGAGELVPRAAVGTSGDRGSVAVPLAVDGARVPASVHAGTVVDVWAGPDPDAGVPARRTVRLLRGAPVLSVARPEGLGPGTVVQVVVGVPQGRADAVAASVAGLSGRSLLVVARD